jgi:hypothetical protein
MPRHPCTAAVARIAAALLALTISGAPRVLAMHAPVEGHRCECKTRTGGHRECDCAICRKAAHAADASEQRKPRCHRTAGPEALASTDSRGSGNDGTPCMEGTCGNRARPVVTIAAVEPFCLPVRGVLAPALVEEAGQPFSPRLLERSLDPETPPPKAA